LSRVHGVPAVRIAGALVVAGALFACSDVPTPVAIRVTLDGDPVAGLDVRAYPFDPDRLLDSLAAASGLPRPDFSDLEAELLAFTPPVPAPDDTAGLAWQATRDSVAALADSLSGVDRRSPDYREAYRRFRQLYGRLVQRMAAREASRRDELDPLRDLARRAGQAADSLRAWELAAYAGFDSAVTTRVAATGRRPMFGATNPDGWLTLELPRGTWWLEAVVSHPDNPFAEYRWSVALVSAGFPLRIPLSDATVQLGWRH